MRQMIRRFVIAFVLTLGFLAGLGYGQPRAHGAPTMTPDAAPVPRIAPTADITLANASPLPKPGLP
jgi:hypothetical protein